jgi:ABC-2 type transport system ATP-binding protein
MAASQPAAGVDAFRLHQLVKTYVTGESTVRAVDGIDVAVAPGEAVALLGPNGAGKSTTVDMLLGLTEPDSGSVSIFGVDPREAVSAGSVGAMLQTGALIRDLSVRELLAMMASLYPAPVDVDSLLETTGLTSVADRRTQTLSGGQSQRARLAVALASDPDLLVLDEPTVGMDVESRQRFWATMREFSAREKTVLFATHYLEEADANADRVVLIAGGRIVADGSTTEVKAMVGGRSIRATLPGVELAALERLPGVTHAERHGDTVVLSCSDSDVALRALLASYADARDVEVSSAGLEAAFLALTASPRVEAVA